MKKIITICMLIISFINYGQNTTGYNLIASYPFTTNLSDATGSYSDAQTTNAPIQNGAIYLNGVYNDGTVNNYSELFTDQIASFDTNDFIIKLDFKSENTTSNDILVCGRYYRWLQIYVDSAGKLTLLAYDNSGYYSAMNTSETISVNTWYSIGIKYKHSDNQIKVYLNANLIGTHDLPANFEFIYSNDFVFTPENGGSGTMLKGYWKNLKIYGNTSANIKNENFDLIQLYPNPSQGIININTKNEIKSVKVYDLAGKLISVNLTGNIIELDKANSGIYFVKINIEGQIITKKIIVK